MPNYQYKCKKCDNSFEIEQGINEDSLFHCEKCKNNDLYRVIGNVGIVFNGTGFYCKDNKK